MRSSMLPMLLVILSMASIQFGATMAKSLLDIIGVAGTTMLRTSLAAGMLLAVQRPWVGERLTRSAWLMVGLYGTSLGFMNLFFYLSLDRLPLGIGVAIQFIGPLGVALMASQRRLDWLWALFAVVGLMVLVFSRSPHDTDGLDFIGIGYALAAALCWALYIIFGQKASGYMPPGRASSFGLLISALVILPFGVFHGWEKLLHDELWLIAPLVAFFSSALPYSLEINAMSRLPAKTFGVLMSLEPAFATLFGHYLLHEVLLWEHWLAILIIICASMGSVLTGKLPPKELAPV